MSNREGAAHGAAAPILEARAVRKEYVSGPGRLAVLRGVDLAVEPGEIVGIVGVSGAGKSTLLHILGALDRPTSGEVFIDAREVSRLPDAELARVRGRRVGFVFQFHHLLPEFTALENVFLPRLVAGAPPQEAEDAARRLLDAVGLSARLEHRPSELSGGEQQRVAVARALVNSPAVVLADEPSGNLDKENGNLLQDLLWGLRDRFGQTFVIATHDARIVERADRVVRIEDGVVVSETKRAAPQAGGGAGA